MATPDQKQALLAITCPWCRAVPGEVCSMVAPGGRARRDAEEGVRKEKRVPITTLDAGCHDARWQAAGLGTAPVRTDVVLARHRDDLEARSRPQDAPRAAYSAAEAPWEDQAPAVAPAAGGERPW